MNILAGNVDQGFIIHKDLFLLSVYERSWLTAGGTGKGGMWRKNPPDAESAVGVTGPKVRERPALVRRTQLRWRAIIFHASTLCVSGERGVMLGFNS